MSRTGSEYDVLIIGAGMSGLAAAIRLSLFDVRVAVLEKHFVPGGLNSYYRRGGFDLDVGLHAMTNWPEGAGRHAPLPKLLRQLRIQADEFDLAPQLGAEIRFPGRTLHFSNDFSLLENEISREFPAQIDGFRKLTETIINLDDTSLQHGFVSARERLTSFITDPVLVDMLLCPLQYYGSANENDMDFSQLAIMFKSIFREGFCRPREGVRRLLSVLTERCDRQGVDIRYRAAVKEILTVDQKATGVRLENGEELQAPLILSSAGAVETWRLIKGGSVPTSPATGMLSFVEVIACLDQDPAEFGFNPTIVFHNTSDQFTYARPDRLVDTRSAVICCPNHFQFPEPLSGGMLRLTHMADYDSWLALDPQQYKAAKQDLLDRSLDFFAELAPGCGDHIRFIDVFTPLTVERFTGHVRGAVYGSPEKFRDGATPWNGVKLIGTDQGFLGIVGAMLSGISMANLHGLMGR